MPRLRMPLWLEAGLVLGAAFGYPVGVSLGSLWWPAGESSISEAGLRWLLIYEAALLAVLWGFLHLRGWRLQHIGLRPGLLDTLIGLALASVCYLVISLVWSAAELLSRKAGMVSPEPSVAIAADVQGLTIIAVSLLNPLFEELFVCGYLITVLKRSGCYWLAIHLSVLLRLVYHLYQGFEGVATIIPIGFIFALWFARTARLWPLVVAHAAFDWVGLNDV